MKPLQGIKVLDLTHALAGPMCTYQLRLLGADVIKVERPDVGDDMRHYTEHAGLKAMAAPFVAANAGKRSIALDLKAPPAQEILRRMIARSDVMIENFRPGVPAKLGLDWPSVRKINPRLVYCTITGFGQTGMLRDWPAYDHIVQAMSGVMFINGEADQGPLKVGIPFADTFAGYLAALAVVSALFQRQHSGEGQFIDFAMLDAVIAFLGQAFAVYAMSGQPPLRTGNRGFRLVATSDTYETADGFLSIGANHQHQFEAMCRVLGREDLLSDPRFADHRARFKHGAELRETLAAIFKTRSAEELEAKLAERQVPASKVRRVSDVVAHPHVAERGVFISGGVPGLDRPIALAGAGYRFEHDGPETALDVPAIGQHSDEVLAELGYSAAEIAGLRAAKVV